MGSASLCCIVDAVRAGRSNGCPLGKHYGSAKYVANARDYVSILSMRGIADTTRSRTINFHFMNWPDINILDKYSFGVCVCVAHAFSASNHRQFPWYSGYAGIRISLGHACAANYFHFRIKRDFCLKQGIETVVCISTPIHGAAIRSRYWKSRPARDKVTLKTSASDRSAVSSHRRTRDFFFHRMRWAGEIKTYHAAFTNGNGHSYINICNFHCKMWKSSVTWWIGAVFCARLYCICFY